MKTDNKGMKMQNMGISENICIFACGKPKGERKKLVENADIRMTLDQGSPTS